MNKQNLLDEIRDNILEQNICPELAKSAFNLVMGDGNPDADIVLIGEAPGRKEDELGLPFVGASGRFLDQMLAAAELERTDVYITNIVKYRPPDNRDPSPAEKQAFWPYLVRQLEVIRPKVIITLGRHTGMSFIPDLVISRDHGQPKRVELVSGEYVRSSGSDGVRGASEQRTIILLPLYHPAAALYNGSMRQVLIDDFVQTKKLVDNLYTS